MQEIKVLFDNNLTLLYSVMMSLWATIYLELWKRYSALLTHRKGPNIFLLLQLNSRLLFLLLYSATRFFFFLNAKKSRQYLLPTSDFKFSCVFYIYGLDKIILSYPKSN